MNRGRLCFGAKTSAGCDWPNAAEPAKRTRQIVAYVIGSRGEPSCRLLWERVPATYKTGLLYTDFWSAYAEVLPEAQHRATGKGAGQTCHIERFNNILRQRLARFVLRQRLARFVLRQRLARFVRRTLSFSKTDEMHENCLRLFLHEYNQQKGAQPTRHQPKRCRLV